METSITPEASKVPVSVLNTESTLVEIKLKIETQYKGDGEVTLGGQTDNTKTD